MRVRRRLLWPVLMALAGCSQSASVADSGGPGGTTSAAPPQRVTAASNALGQRLDSMLANPSYMPAALTR